MIGLKPSEIFAWCLTITAISLAALAVGGPGALCVIAGMLIGDIDVSWIKDDNEKEASDA